MRVVRKGTDGPIGECDNLTQFYSEVYWGTSDKRSHSTTEKTSDLQKYEGEIITLQELVDRGLTTLNG